MTQKVRQGFVRAVSVLAAIGFIEGASYGGLIAAGRLLNHPIRRTSQIYVDQSKRILSLLDRTNPPREQIDAVLGWRYRPGHQDGGDVVNRQGLRSGREYDAWPAVGTLRIAAFGDSFVYGNEVRPQDSWPQIMERHSSQIEVLNFGVGGYGVDQAFLRYVNESTRFHPQIVLLVFFPDDLRRLVNVYRRFIDDGELPLAKPRYRLDEQRNLVLLRSPWSSMADYERLLQHPDAVTEIGRRDHWYMTTIYENPLYDWSATVRLLVRVGGKVYDGYLDRDRIFRGKELSARSEAFRIQIAIFREFVQRARARHERPFILLLPDRSSIMRARSGLRTHYEPIAEAVQSEGLPMIDAIEAFRFRTSNPGESIDAWFMPGGHYSPRGNEIVAQLLLARLQEASLRASSGAGN